MEECLVNENLSPIIPSSMRPPKSLIGQVKNTLSSLVSSVFRKSTVKFSNKKVAEKDTEKNNFECNVDKILISAGPSGFDKTTTSNSSSVSKSHFLRSKEEYLRRLKTFTLPFWCGKPLTLSPPLLSLYGWECIGENIAKCCVCGAVIAINLPWPNSSNYRSICNEMVEKIAIGHKKVCSWPNNPVSATYLNPFDECYLSKEDNMALKQEFIERANRLYSLKKQLPRIEKDVLKELEFNDSTLTHLIKIVNFNHSSTDDGGEDLDDNCVQISSVVLSICGWDTRSNNKVPSIHCSDTGRTIGLWNFYSILTEPNSPLPCKRRKIDEEQSSLFIEKGKFHPVKQHHVWSPWIVSLNSILSLMSDPTLSVQKTDTKPGWIVVRDIVLGSAKEALVDEESVSKSIKPTLSYKSPPHHAILQARRLIQNWSSP